ncbi:hypothetical protein [Polynucleobacter difficilis]|uniref:hypothetical protein n=1 Tax=Polynucleobacter difficilis TaxID=556054 RepID=UPI00131F3AAB|nr:hypothetical protein [Polynucleobacter difficilis]
MAIDTALATVLRQNTLSLSQFNLAYSFLVTNMVKLRTAGLIVISALFLSACAGTPVKPSFTNMASTFAQSLAAYQTDGVLTNIIRASEERPLSFLDIPSINGSGNVSQSHSAGLTLGALSVNNLYGSIASVSPNFSVSLGTSFNFTQSSLDNATFWSGILSKVQPKGLAYFRNPNIPRELLFALAIESIDITDAQGKTSRYVNSPLEPNYPQFEKVLYELLESGLDVVATAVPAPASGQQPQSNKQAPNQQQATVSYNLCLIGNMANTAKEMKYDSANYCGGKLPALFNPNDKNAAFTVNLRSPKQIFNYLGEVVQAQNLTDPKLVRLPPTTNTTIRKSGESNQYALIVVEKNASSTSNLYASTVGTYGDYYSVPKENNGYSPLVIDMLLLMITLNKISGSIPQQPAVLIR